MGLHVLRAEIHASLVTGEVLRLACGRRGDQGRLVGVEPVDAAYVGFPDLLAATADVVRPDKAVTLEKRVVGRRAEDHEPARLWRVGVIQILRTGENVVIRGL